MNKIQSKIQFNVLWSCREQCSLFSIVSINYINNNIKIHEFILSYYFGTYEMLKRDFVLCDEFKQLEFSSSIISDNYHLEYKYFELIIKYFYGLECNLENISLNDLCKIHAFLTKHCVNNDKTDLIDIIENKIEYIIYCIPIINVHDRINNCDTYKTTCQVLFCCNAEVLKNTINKYKYYLHKYYLIKNENSCYDCWNSFKLEFEHKTIHDLNELFDNYEEYLLDDYIYDYVLSLIFRKYNLHNKEYTFKLPCKAIKIKKTDNEIQMMEKLGYFNLMKHKYYTLSFLNKNFIKIKKNDVDAGYYDDYINSENMYTKHAVLKCAEMA